MAELTEEQRTAKVEEALYKRCTGYKETVSKPVKLKRIMYSETGKKISEEEYIEYTKESKNVEPNVPAIAMYLKNRLPQKWGNVNEAEFTRIALEVLDE